MNCYAVVGQAEYLSCNKCLICTKLKLKTNEIIVSGIVDDSCILQQNLNEAFKNE